MDLTNARQAWCPAGTNCQITKPSNPSIDNHYQRKIAGGLLSEWGVLGEYKMDEGDFDPYQGYWVIDSDGEINFLIGHLAGTVYGYRSEESIERTAICTTN